MMLRLFFAILLPEEAREAVGNVQQSLRAQMDAQGVRWTLPEHWHYTLKFLGDASESQLSDVTAVGQAASTQMTPFSLSLSGVGVFPEQRSPQVLWIGADKGVPELARLAEYLDRELKPHGFAPETRAYRPHLTLARMKTPEGEESVARTLPVWQASHSLLRSIATFTARDLALVQSELRPEGAHYTVRNLFALSGDTEYNR